MNALIVPQHIKIDETIIRQDENGRYCINDLHKASGGEERNKPKFFLENKKTQELVQELTEGGNPTSPVEVIRGGLNQGTYVVKELVYSYAMWISAKFNLKVIRTFDQVVNASKQPQIPQTLSEALQLAADQARQLELAAPKVAFVDKYVAGNGNKTFRQVAKLLQIKEYKFREFLESNRIMYKLNGEWTAYQNHVDAKRFHVKTGVSDSGHAFNHALFTPKGIEWIAGELAKFNLRGVA